LLQQLCIHGCLPPELFEKIFLLNNPINSWIPLVNDIAQNCNTPLNFVDAIERVCSKCGNNVSAVLVKISLKKAGKSLFNIRFERGWAGSQYATDDGYVATSQKY